MSEEIKSYESIETVKVTYFVCPVCNKEHENLIFAKWCLAAHKKEEQQATCEHQWYYTFRGYEEPPALERNCQICKKEETKILQRLPDEILPAIFELLP